MNEIWKDVVGYEGVYQVSNLGNVKSLPRLVKRKHLVLLKEKILKPGTSSGGYFIVILRKEMNSKVKKIHQLVAITFLNHKVDKHKIVVDHINNNPQDNRVENLQLITARENCSKDRINTSSKYTGVTWDKSKNKWTSQIQINKKQLHLGRYKTELEAHQAYQNKLKTLLK